ncbi:MAG: DNA mismatch endonuclease Vsr [Planctomycetota bacterium]
MADRLTPSERSENMRRIRSSGTKPEEAVDAALKSLRYHYRRSDGDLAGSPDFVLERHPVVIFVHGCFWHRHRGCRKAYTPKSRADFWKAKFEENTARDRCVVRQLRRLGWRVITVWECQTHDPAQLKALLKRRISARRQHRPVGHRVHS